MIEREQVLHVARLARLRLDEAELDRATEQLSGILEHVDKLAELDLDGVPPTSHVVPLENVLRPDRAVPSLDRETALRDAPDSSGDSFRVPSPQA